MNSSAAQATSDGVSVSTPPSRRAANGSGSGDERERFNSVVLPYLSEAYTLACWLTGSRTDSEDVVQDACLRAFRGIGKFSNGSARAWVLTIVRNVAYSWLHGSRAAGRVWIDDPEALEREQFSEPDCNTPETMLMAADDATQLQAVISALPTPFREALVLRELQGLAYREIAQVTGVSIGTVMSRLARARARLCAQLKNEKLHQN